MTPEQVRTWRLSLRPLGRRRKVSREEAAARIGISPRTLYRYEHNGCESHTVALAMAAVQFGLPGLDELPTS